MANKTLALDETRDMFFFGGELAMIEDSEAIKQNVLNTLLVYKGEFEKDTDHGTDYDAIFNNTGITDDEILEIIRDAIFQEPNVAEIESITMSRKNRKLEINFTAMLKTGSTITAEVVI